MRGETKFNNCQTRAASNLSWPDKDQRTRSGSSDSGKLSVLLCANVSSTTPTTTTTNTAVGGGCYWPI